MANWSDRVSQMTQNAISKSKEVAGVAKLNVEISSLNQEIRNIQIQAGAYVLDNGFLMANPYIAEWAEKVNSLKAEIEEKNEKIMELKNVVICKGCGKEVSRSNRFCENCGTEIIVKAPVTDMAETENAGEVVEVVATEVTEENTGTPAAEGIVEEAAAQESADETAADNAVVDGAAAEDTATVEG